MFYCNLTWNLTIPISVDVISSILTVVQKPYIIPPSQPSANPATRKPGVGRMTSQLSWKKSVRSLARDANRRMTSARHAGYLSPFSSSCCCCCMWWGRGECLEFREFWLWFWCVGGGWWAYADARWASSLGLASKQALGVDWAMRTWKPKTSSTSRGPGRRSRDHWKRHTSAMTAGWAALRASRSRLTPSIARTKSW